MKSKFLKSEFSRNVATLLTGSAVAQIIPIAVTPILTRIFSPEEFGTYTFYMALVTFLLVIASARYENAIPLPKEDKDAINIFALSFLILFFVTALLVIGLFFFETVIHDALGSNALGYWIWLVPVTVFFAGASKILTFWSNRQKRFKNTSMAMIASTTGRVGIQLVAGPEKFGILSAGKSWTEFYKAIFSKTHKTPSGITDFGVGTLIVTFTMGFILSTLFLIFPFLKKEKVLLKSVSSAGMKTQAKRYINFPKINTFHALSDELKNIGLTWVILYAFNEMILGFYSMTVRILRAPLAIIGTAFSQVFYQKAAEMFAHDQNLVPLIKSTVRKMLLIAAPIFLVILIAGPWLFEFVLGDQWRIAGVYAQYLTPWLYLSFAIGPVLQVSSVLNKQGSYFLVSLVHNVIILGSVLIGGVYFSDLTVGFLILSALQIVFYFFVYHWVIRLAKNTFEANSAE